MEITILISISVISITTENFDKPGSMTFKEFSLFLWVCALVRRFYNTYCEAIYFSFPQYRTQSVDEHKLAESKKDLNGREMAQLKQLESQDRLTLLSQFALELTLYSTLPGYFPAPRDTYEPFAVRFGKLLLNHYVMSFAMYWTHRALHIVPWLWDNIHSFHHWARHPLSRNTYEDHWLDNLTNAVIGHCCAQILVPLDYHFFYASRLFRILESLEKHSGFSCHFNLAHSIQRWLPFAQMPHHHDWHHEGHKACNFTFSSLGGVWDYVFGTRKEGRAMTGLSYTREDAAQAKAGKRSNQGIFGTLRNPMVAVCPPILVFLAALVTVSSTGGVVGDGFLGWFTCGVDTGTVAVFAPTGLHTAAAHPNGTPASY